MPPTATCSGPTCRRGRAHRGSSRSRSIEDMIYLHGAGRRRRAEPRHRARRANRRSPLEHAGHARNPYRWRHRCRRHRRLGPHLQLGTRELLHRCARCPDGQGSVAVLHGSRRRRAGRRDVGRRARRVERRAASWGLPGSYDPARGLVYWGIANPMPNTRHRPAWRQSERDSCDGAGRALQQLDGSSRRRRPAGWPGITSIFPATAGTWTSTTTRR